jgi:hypothetical protein
LVDKLAKQVLLSSKSVDLNTDISESTWTARNFRATPPTFAFHPRIRRKLFPQTKTTLSRASGAVSAFLVKIMFDCGYFQAPRVLLPDAAEHLWICPKIPFTPSCSIQKFFEDVNLDIARNWMTALNTSGANV